MSKSRKSADAGYARADQVEPNPPEPQPDGNGEVDTTANGDAVYVPQAGDGAPPPAARKKPTETKSQRFLRLAERRVNKALAALRTIIPLANRAQYEYGPEEVDAIKGELATAVNDIARAFAGTPEIRTGFRFH